MNHRALTFQQSPAPSVFAPARALVPRGRAATYVGLTLFHSVSDREQAAAQIDAQMSSLYNDIMRAMGVPDPGVFSPIRLAADPQHAPAAAIAARETMTKSPLFPWWQGFSKQFETWNAFRDSQGGLKEYFLLLNTSWDDYKRWLELVKKLRADAHAHGIGISMMDPVDFSKSVVDKIEDVGRAAASGTGEAWSIVKIAIYAALALAGGLGLVFIINEFRSQSINKVISKR